MCAASVSAVGAGCDPGSHLAVAAAPTYIGGHILRSPPPSQFHILTITTMSTIVIFTKIILTYQAAAGAGCDPTLQLQLPHGYPTERAHPQVIKIIII